MSRFFSVLIAVFCFLSAVPPTLPQEAWHKNTAMRAEITSISKGDAFDDVAVKLTNLGPLMLFYFEPIGTARPVIRVEGLFEGNWRRISVPSDLPATCLPLKPSESLTLTATTDHRLFRNVHPSKIGVAWNVYPTKRECENGKRGVVIHSIPRDY